MTSAPKVVVLALGSNVGKRRENLESALAEISGVAEVVARSKIYSTPPSGYADQPDFLNAAVAVKTRLSPTELLAFCKRTEAVLGRVRRIVNGPREIDVDIILYEGVRMKTETLEIPHARWRTRGFVITPMLDLLDAGALSSPAFAEERAFLANSAREFGACCDFQTVDKNG